MKTYDARERLEKIKKLSGELREIVLKKYPDMIEEEVDFITSYLGKELKFFFKPFDKEIRKMQDEIKREYTEEAIFKKQKAEIPVKKNEIKIDVKLNTTEIEKEIKETAKRILELINTL